MVCVERVGRAVARLMLGVAVALMWECWLRMQLEIFANNTLHFTLSRFNPDLLRDEPLDKVRAVIAEAQRIHGL